MQEVDPAAPQSRQLPEPEVDRPNRQRRRRKGKSDPEDAISAARAAQSGDANGSAKTRDGNVEAMRVIRVARISARQGRTQALNQMRSLISTAPDPFAKSCATSTCTICSSGRRPIGLAPNTT